MLRWVTAASVGMLLPFHIAGTAPMGEVGEMSVRRVQMISPASPPFYCPNCGTESNYLDEVTGWCAICSGSTSVASTKIELAFTANADAVEFYVSTTNASVWQALT